MDLIDVKRCAVLAMCLGQAAWLACSSESAPQMRRGGVSTATAGANLAGGLAPSGPVGQAGTGYGGNATPVTGVTPPGSTAPGTTFNACINATVAFVIDGSGSMCEPFGSSTRWTALRSALLDKTKGLIYKLQGQASFGMYLYDGSLDPSLLSQAGGPASTCTSPGTRRRLDAMGCEQIVEVKPMLQNAAAIDMRYPAEELGGSTPTDKAMNHVVDSLLQARGPSYSMEANPQFIILATDGAPNDICTGGMGGDGTLQQMNVVAAVDRAAQMGIKTFVISLASDAMLQAHLDTVAKHGNVADPNAHTFSPMSSDELVMTLTTVLSGALNCLF